MQYPAIMQPTRARIEQIPPPEAGEEDDPASQAFPPVPPSVARNFIVTDTYLEAPSGGIAPVTYDDRPIPEVDDSYIGDFLAPFRGLSAVSDDIKNELPPECREAFNKALEREKAWHAKWGTEKESKARRDPIIDKAIVPFNMQQ